MGPARLHPVLKSHVRATGSEVSSQSRMHELGIELQPRKSDPLEHGSLAWRWKTAIDLWFSTGWTLTTY